MTTDATRQKEIQAVVSLCYDELNLKDAKLYGAFDYRSLPFCVIDSVFSINANYTSTENTVSRFCAHFGLQARSQKQPPEIIDQMSVAAFIDLYQQYGIEGMATQVYQNRQRTSTRNGILKSDAVLRFSKVLAWFEVNYFQDVDRILDNPDFESHIMQIPGQASGLSLRYFYMWVGGEHHIKPDRMITRFIQSAIGRSPSIQDSYEIITGACEILAKNYPHLTPRVLDNLIWQYQRAQK